MTIVSSIDWQQASQEVVVHLQKLLQLDTRNPPGNEVRAAKYLRDVLAQEGITGEIVGPSPDRGSLVVRLHGDGSAPPLLLMGHTDVVAVEPERWTHAPFSGDIADGYIYGRGALDMKNMVAMELMVMLLLKRHNVPLKRDVIFMASADEETGGQQGAGWIAQHRPELIRAEYALSEGGGDGLEILGKRYYTVEAAEKGTARFLLRTKGTPGHGSVPIHDNAVLKLSTLLNRLATQRTPAHLTHTFQAYIQAIASTQPEETANAFLALLESESTVDDAIDALPVPASMKDELHAMVRNTTAPTVLRAGSQGNVIPSEAEAIIDSRRLPGSTLEQLEAEMRAIFGEEPELEFLNPDDPLEFDPHSPLFDIIREVVQEHDPEANVLPYMVTGGTDAGHVVPLGTRVYGFEPILYEPGGDGGSRVHGHDERITINALQWGMHVLYDVVSRFVAQS
jgi:acetylornithine deacetylase/succinyl-diaminopimelate desuccinylase-like protein